MISFDATMIPKRARLKRMRLAKQIEAGCGDF